jgi:glutamine synthetase
MGLRVITGGGDVRLGMAEYVWVDAKAKVRSKSRTIQVASDPDGDPVPIPENWTIREGGIEFILLPCHYLADPLRPQPSFIVLCEVRDLSDRIAYFNGRAPLRDLVAKDQWETWWGFTQPYSLWINDLGRTLSIGSTHYQVAERHFGACMDAGLMISSACRDRPPGREGLIWDFKVGPRRLPPSIDPDTPNALVVADHLWIARHLLIRVAREFGLVAQFPWNYRMTVSFSTDRMRADEKLTVENAQWLSEEFEARRGEDIERLYQHAREDPYYNDETAKKWAEENAPHFDFRPRVSAPDHRRTYAECSGWPAAHDPYAVASRVLSLFSQGGGDRVGPEEGGDREGPDLGGSSTLIRIP